MPIEAFPFPTQVGAPLERTNDPAAVQPGQVLPSPDTNMVPPNMNYPPYQMNPNDLNQGYPPVNQNYPPVQSPPMLTTQDPTLPTQIPNLYPPGNPNVPPYYQDLPSPTDITPLQTDAPMQVPANPPLFDYPSSDIQNAPPALPSIQIDYPPNPNPTFSPDEILRGINATNQTAADMSASLLGTIGSSTSFTYPTVTARLNPVSPSNKAGVNQSSEARDPRGVQVGMIVACLSFVVLLC